MPLPAYLADDARRSVAKVALACRSKTLCGFVLDVAFFLKTTLLILRSVHHVLFLTALTAFTEFAV